MNAALIAAIGDDAFGTEILDYLRSEGVDTTLITVVPDEATPVTGVITLDTGKSCAIGWKNEDSVHISPRDISSSPEISEALSRCDLLFVSFEPPIDSVERAIQQAADGGAAVIVAPAPPADRRPLNPETQALIDFLVTNPWEMAEFSRRRQNAHEQGEGLAADIAGEAQRLLLAGVKQVCLLVDGQCRVFTRDNVAGSFQVPAWPTNLHESAGSRDAFCAMLAYQLSQNSWKFTKRAAYWATAAMAYAGGQLGVPKSMPRLAQVTDIIEHGQILVPDD